MKKILSTLALCLCAVGSMQAQTLKQQGSSIGQIVPQGWTHQEVMGDLNKDGIRDLVVVAKPNFKENMKTRDDGYEYNFNKPILAIYFGKTAGGFQLWKQYKELFPADDEWSSVEISLGITEKGALNISTSTFSSGGSYDNGDTRYTYRYQNGDFYLIGKESTSMSRNIGDLETVSENYLTWKRQIITDNVFEEGKKKEVWSKLTKQPLKKLGAHEL